MQIPKGYLFFKTLSGDRYMIPEAQYEDDIKQYNLAMEANDDAELLEFEQGMTGWLYAPEPIDLS